MFQGRMFLAAAALVVAASSVVQAAGPQNYLSMFESTSHDFGTVARAAKAEHRFEFVNTLDQPVHISGIRASCGCTTPIVETETVMPGETGSILAKFNTGSFTGQRAATLTVTFNQPAHAEIQLQVKGYIRSDVVFNPGEVNFGTVSEGETKSIKLLVDYAGRSDWAIVGLQTADSYIKARAEQTTRQANRVGYELTVTLLDNAPVGPYLSEVIVQTNDRNLKTVSLVVQGVVQPGIDVQPRSLSLAADGGNQTKHVFVLKGKEPFRITDVTSEQLQVSFQAAEDARAVHTLPVQVELKSAAALESGKLTIHTDSESFPTIDIDLNSTK